MFKKIIIYILSFIFIFTINSVIINNITKASGDLGKSTFMIDTDNLGFGGKQLKTGTAKESVDNTLSVIVTKLMVGIGVVSLLMMTIGGGYIILSHGQDELLSKGKSIFNAGMIALVVALGSGLIMKVVINLLY